MNLVPIPYKYYYRKQRNRKIAFKLLLVLGFISLCMSLLITFKREQIRKQLLYMEQSFRQESYQDMVQSKVHIIEQENYLKALEMTHEKLQSEKMQILTYLEYLKSTDTSLLQIQGYTLDWENHFLELRGYAENRGKFLEYIEQLEERSIFKNLNFEVSNDNLDTEVSFIIWLEIE